MFQNIYELIRNAVPGVSWKHPVVAFGLRVLDPLDWLFRAVKGLGHLPKLSLRVRSNGLRGQFGGTKFDELGNLFAAELIRLADIEATSQVLEIGCGVGRNAFGLATVLNQGGFKGVDIDLPSIEGASNNRFLRKHGFDFTFIDVKNAEYNPDGTHKASEFTFPFEQGSLDVVFLVSVVTHILPDDLEHYVQEIARMLKPGGRIVFTTFLMDEATEFDGRPFSYGSWPWRSTNEDIPEICVGYYLDYLDDLLIKSGFERKVEPALSIKRGLGSGNHTTGFGQDIVVALRNAQAG